MKGHEGPKGQKLKNGAGLDAAKFFVWEIVKTEHFWQLVGGGPQKLTRKRPKYKEMKAHKAKMGGNEGPQCQNERKWKPTRPKWKEMKALKAKMKGNEGPQGQKLENGAGLGAAKFFVWEIELFGNLWGGPRSWPGKPQNARKWRPTTPKWKEMKAQKAKMKGNEGPKGQNERKWRPKRPKWKEMNAQKAKMKGNEGTKGTKGQKIQKSWEARGS